MLTKDENQVSSLTERRLFDRFPARFPAKFKDTRDGFGTKVSIDHISAGGVAIVTTEHFYRNDSVTLEVQLPASAEPLCLKGRVVWVRRTEAGLWEVGLEFHRPQLLSLWRLCHVIESSLS